MQVKATRVPGNAILMYWESWVMAKALNIPGSRTSRMEETDAGFASACPTVNSSLRKIDRSLGFAFNADFS